MKKENQKPGDSRYAVWVAIIGGIFAVVVAVVNKKTGNPSNSSAPGGVNVTVTTGESQKNEAPATSPAPPPRSKQKPKPTPCFDTKMVLRHLDACIAQSDKALKDMQDVAQYEAWRSESESVFNVVKRCNYETYAEQFKESVPPLDGSHWHSVEGATKHGKQILANLRKAIISAHQPFSSR